MPTDPFCFTDVKSWPDLKYRRDPAQTAALKKGLVSPLFLFFLLLPKILGRLFSVASTLVYGAAWITVSSYTTGFRNVSGCRVSRTTSITWTAGGCVCTNGSRRRIKIGTFVLYSRFPRCLILFFHGYQYLRPLWLILDTWHRHCSAIYATSLPFRPCTSFRGSWVSLHGVLSDFPSEGESNCDSWIEELLD